MKKAEIIDKAIVGLFISEFKNKRQSIQIGDIDPSYIEGGLDNLHWFSLTVNDDAKWLW